MSFSLSSITKLVTDPGELVEKACDAFLPARLQIIGDAAASAIDLGTGNAVAALHHGLDAIKDLPQLLPGHATKNGDGTSPTPVSTGGTEPGPPPGSTTPSSGPGSQDSRTPSLGDVIERALEALVAVLTGGQGAPPREDVSSIADDLKAGGSTAQSADDPLTSVESSTGPEGTVNTSGATAVRKSAADLVKLTDSAFLDAVRAGGVPADLLKDPQAALQIQQRMSDISQMNQLLTNLSRALHDMQMAVIQNVRA